MNIQYIHTHAYIHICIYACTYIHIHIYWTISTCLPKTNPPCAPKPAYDKDMCTGLPLYIHTCMHTYIHTAWSQQGHVYMTTFCTAHTELCLQTREQNTQDLSLHMWLALQGLCLYTCLKIANKSFRCSDFCFLHRIRAYHQVDCPICTQPWRGVVLVPSLSPPSALCPYLLNLCVCMRLCLHERVCMLYVYAWI